MSRLVVISFAMLWTFTEVYSLKPDKACVPTSMVKGPCHTCVCATSGIYHCREEKCSHDTIEPTKKPETEQCQPNAMYRNDTLFCTCDDDGYFVSINCMKYFHYLRRLHPWDGSLRSHDFNNLRCMANKYYLTQCNVCRCGADGIIDKELCTHRSCTPTRTASKANRCKFGQYVRTEAEFCACSDVDYYIDRLCVPVQKSEFLQRIPSNDLATTIEIHKSWSDQFETLRNAEKFTCNPDAYYHKDCNKCLCDPDIGDLVCTKIVCEKPFQDTYLNVTNDYGNIDFVTNYLKEFDSNSTHLRLRTLAQSHKTLAELPEIKEGETCTPGKVYKMDCNKCYCSRAQELICTKVACVDPNVLKKVQQKLKWSRETNKYGKLLRNSCIPGKLYDSKQGCKKCFCNDRKVTVCSSKPCDEIPKIIQSPYDLIPKLTVSQHNKLPALNTSSDECKPGRTYKLLCDTCVCLDDGNLFCEKKICLSTDETNWVVARKLTGKHCDTDIDNPCVSCECVKKKLKCAAEEGCVPPALRDLGNRRQLHGYYASTTKKPKKQKKGNGDKEVLSENEKCIPQMVYKQDCNNCYCQDDGTLRCTGKGCLTHQEVKLFEIQKQKLLLQEEDDK